MALTASGAITLDAMHVEAGGTTGSACTINDTDIIGLIDKTAGATMAFNEWYGASASFYNFGINQSCRFEDAFLTKTHGSAGNRRTWTFSAWIKRGKVGVQQNIYNPHDGGNETQMHILSTDVFRMYDAGGGGFNAVSAYKFRDLSAWYHIVVRIDTTSATAANRIRLYVNGVEQALLNSGDGVSAYGTAEPTRNYDTEWNMATLHVLGAYGSNTAQSRFFGYMADVNMIDGSSLGPDSFGETKNDIWIPKDTTDLSFGTNGFRMKFQDSTAFGDDTSGTGTDFATTGLAASDQSKDSPTNNFSTFNPIAPDTTGATNHSFSEGNLKVSTGSNSWWNCFGTISITPGKYYWEYYALGSGDVDQNIGVCTLDWHRGSNAGADTADAYSLYAASDGNGYLYTDGASAVNKGTGYCWTHADIMSVAFDADTGKIWYAKNGTFLGSGDPAAGSNVAHTVTAGDLAKGMLPVFSGYHTAATPMINFGQDSSFAGNETAQGNKDGNGKGDFYYSPPSGYLSLSTFSLPDPVATVDPNKGGSPQDYFSSVLYTGNGGDQTITGVGFQPDWTWIKHRTEAHDHVITDSVRPIDKILFSNGVDSDTSGGEITSFNSDGFVLEYSGTDTQAIKFNESSDTYVSWNWKAGTSFSNDASSTSVGNVDSAGTVNTDVGFSIINFVVTTDATMQIAHGLGKIPKMIISKNRDTNSNWDVYHSFVGNEHRLKLNSTAAIEDQDGVWADTTPTSSVFYQKGNGSWHAVGGNVLAYCFAEVDGYSKFGSYVGNGNADGTFVYTGFRPAFIIYKKTSGTGNWGILDNKKSPFNLNEAWQAANLQNAETNESARAVDFLSNGFKARGTNADLNTSSGTYIYMAFAEQPFKYANAR